MISISLNIIILQIFFVIFDVTQYSNDLFLDFFWKVKKKNLFGGLILILILRLAVTFKSLDLLYCFEAHLLSILIQIVMISDLSSTFDHFYESLLSSFYSFFHFLIT